MSCLGQHGDCGFSTLKKTGADIPSCNCGGAVYAIEIPATAEYTVCVAFGDKSPYWSDTSYKHDSTGRKSPRDYHNGRMIVKCLHGSFQPWSILDDACAKLNSHEPGRLSSELDFPPVLG